MMKQTLFTVGILVAATALSGCRSTHVAGVERSDEENAWQAIIRQNYPGYRAPQAKAQASSDNTEERVSQVKFGNQPEKPADDTLAEVKADNTKAEESKPAEVKADDAKAEESKPAEVKADAAKADESKPAEVKADAAKADESKPAEVKADDTKAEESKPAEVKADAAKTNPPDPTGSTVYEVKSGDTLGKIAQKHYGNARFSNVIFKANSDILKNPNMLRPGMKLIVPAL